MYQLSITSRIRQLDSYFERATSLEMPDEVRSDLSRHGIVLVCGFVERSVEIIVLEKIQHKAHPQVRNFVRGHFKKGTKYDCEAIKQLLERFDSKWAAKFKAFIGSRDDLVQALSSAYALRNSIAHGGSSNQGLLGVKKLYAAAKEVIDGMLTAMH